MNKFDEEMIPYYERYDKAMENNDINELAYFSQFSSEPDIRKWEKHKICRNARNFQYSLACGITKVVLDEHGWLEWKIPEYEKQEFHPIGCIINRGACNMKEKQALGVMQLPNGKWIARIDWDYSDIGHPYLYLGIFDEMFDTRTEAWNNAIKEFVDRWHERNKDVKKEDLAVTKAKSMLIVDEVTAPPVMRGEPIQLSLF